MDQTLSKVDSCGILAACQWQWCEYHTHIQRQPPTDIQYEALLTCCHCSRISGRYRRKYFRGKLSVSGQVAGLFQDTSSLRGLRFTGVAFTLSGGSGLTVDRTKRSDQKGQFAHHGEKTMPCLWLEISKIIENNYVINVTFELLHKLQWEKNGPTVWNVTTYC